MPVRSCDPLVPPRVPRLAGLVIEQRVVEIDGHRVAAEIHRHPQADRTAGGDDGPRSGDRTPIVFLHGVLTSTCLASELFEDPAAHEWISLSLPGHFGGRLAAGTTRRDIDASLFVRLIEGALEQLVGSRRVILVGWSLGGFTALAVAAAHPQRVAAVASLAGFAEPRFAGVVRVLSWLVRLPGTGWLVRLGLLLAMVRPRVFWLVTLLTAATWRPCLTRDAKDAINGVWRRYRCHDAASLVMVLARLHTLDIGNRVSGIRCPVWIASGDRDPVVPLAEAQRIAARLPQAEFEVYPRAGHIFFCEWAGFRADFAAWRTSLDAGADRRRQLGET